jgi:hypothetical protein
VESGEELAQVADEQVGGVVGGPVEPPELVAHLRDLADRYRRATT